MNICMFSTSHALIISGLVLAAKIWIDVCEIWKHQIKMNTYVKISSCALDVFKILQDESHNRKRRSTS